MASVERISVGFRNAIRDSVSRSRGPSNRPSSQRSSSLESSTPPPDRKFPFTIQGTNEDFGQVSSQTRSRTKESSIREPSVELDRISMQMPTSEIEQDKSPGQFPFLRYVLIWMIFTSTIGSILIYCIELRKFAFLSCLFLSVGATTSSGLTTINLLELTTASKTILAILAFLGSSVLVSLLPVVVRMHYLKRHIPVELHTFDLKNFQRLPLWVVEYKSLQFIVRLVVAYMLLCYVGGTILILLITAASPKVLDRTDHGSPLGFSIFTSIMSFTNAGLSLRPSFRGEMNPFILIVVDALILAGNTMFPIFIRWIIIYLNKHSKDDSNRKIYFRYLLVNGRNHYAHIFTSQQTWVLVSLHCFFLTFQATCLRLLGTDVNNNQAVFMSINTRHAGFSAVNLDSQNAGILVLFLAMMFLAPTPFAVVLQSSDQEMKPKFIPSDISDNFCNNDDDDLTLSNRPTLTHSVDEEEEEELDGADESEDTVERGVLQLSEGISVWRKRKLTKTNLNTRMASRSLVINLAASQSHRGGASVISVNDSFRTHSTLKREDEGIGEWLDPTVDTRLVLLKKFGGEHVPLRVKILYRLTALKRSLSTLGNEGFKATGSRDLAVVWAVWFLILASEQYTPADANHSAIFNVVFEVCSAFGNVGLSIGSEKHENVSFSADLHTFSQVILIIVMILGRTRELPSQVDGSLHLESSETITEAFLKPGAVVRRNQCTLVESDVEDEQKDTDDAPSQDDSPPIIMEQSSILENPSLLESNSTSC